ncbi:hypothetical protein BC830DRAFT_1122039 [Chytriomyces sp. MP71]|nr:hypothetical protein BC830DRAFT_1122039 [Chytriomyces sp. MP71]
MSGAEPPLVEFTCTDLRAPRRLDFGTSPQPSQSGRQQPAPDDDIVRSSLASMDRSALKRSGGAEPPLEADLTKRRKTVNDCTALLLMHDTHIFGIEQRSALSSSLDGPSSLDSRTSAIDSLSPQHDTLRAHGGVGGPTNICPAEAKKLGQNAPQSHASLNSALSNTAYVLKLKLQSLKHEMASKPADNRPIATSSEQIHHTESAWNKQLPSTSFLINEKPAVLKRSFAMSEALLPNINEKRVALKRVQETSHGSFSQTRHSQDFNQMGRPHYNTISVSYDPRLHPTQDKGAPHSHSKPELIVVERTASSHSILRPTNLPKVIVNKLFMDSGCDRDADLRNRKRNGPTCSNQKHVNEPKGRKHTCGPHSLRPFRDFIFDAERMTTVDVDCLSRLRRYSRMDVTAAQMVEDSGILCASGRLDAPSIPFSCFSTLYHHAASFGKNGSQTHKRTGVTRLSFGKYIVFTVVQHKEHFEAQRKYDSFVRAIMKYLFGVDGEKIPMAFFLAVVFDIALADLTSPIARTVLKVDRTPYLINSTNFASVWEEMNNILSTIDAAKYKKTLELTHFQDFGKFLAPYLKDIKHSRLDVFTEAVSSNPNLTGITLDPESKNIDHILPAFTNCLGLTTIYLNSSAKYKAWNQAYVQSVTFQKLLVAVESWNRADLLSPDSNVSYAFSTLCISGRVRAIEREMVEVLKKRKKVKKAFLIFRGHVTILPPPPVAVVLPASPIMKEADGILKITLQPTKIASVRTIEYAKRIWNVNAAFSQIANCGLDHYYNFRLPAFPCLVAQAPNADGTQPKPVTVNLIQEYLTADLHQSRSNVNEPKRLVQGKPASILGLASLWEGCLLYLTKADCERVIRARMGTFSDVAVAMVLVRTALPGPDKPYSDWACSTYPVPTPAMVQLLAKWREDILRHTVPETRHLQSLWYACYEPVGIKPVQLNKALQKAKYRRPWEEAAAMYEPYLSGREELLKL